MSASTYRNHPSTFIFCRIIARQAFANSAQGIAAFFVFIVRFSGIERLVLEPTGGYEHRVVTALQAAPLPVASIRP
ncbi:IS110 family transposase [Ochrobactrum haematophilum]|uniref:IS110 family transposase n=1 Tax=Brucella haematophila TaxID=419474 RepID=A0ABX1DMH0_9HYPH|nr:IS110 family transposase [Brucella haematophila]